MSNTEGLVNRRPKATAASSGSDRTAGGSAENDKDERSRGSDSENEETGDKQTRLTLMEEVLLLGLKDREVRIVFRFLM